MRVLVVAGALALAACLMPATASAWTPKDCSDWYEEHGTVHPDCQPPPPPPENVTVCHNGETITVPENQAPEGSTPGECAPPEMVSVCRNGVVISIPKGTEQPGDTPGQCAVTPPPPPPPTQPNVTPPPPPEQPVVEDTPPEETPQEQPKPEKPKNIVAGEEQENTPSTTPVQEAGGNGPTLPFTGGEVFVWFLSGIALLGGGFAFRRWLT